MIGMASKMEDDLRSAINKLATLAAREMAVAVEQPIK